jgi:hypothetical protein
MSQPQFERDKQIYADYKAGAKIHEISDYYKVNILSIYGIIAKTRRRYRSGFFKTDESDQREINRLKKVGVNNG